MANFAIEPAASGDAAVLFKLRNDPFIVSLSQLKRVVPWAEHEAWFARAVSDTEHRRIYFIKQGGEAIGVLRFDREGEDAEVSIYLLEPYIGKGIGSEVLRRGCEMIAREWPVAGVVAVIIAGNDRSVRTFRKVGFELQSEGEDQSGRWYLPVRSVVRNGAAS